MVQATVIDHLIHNKLQAFQPCLIAEGTVLLQGSKSGIYLVKISYRIAVIRSRGHIVQQQGRRPDRCKTHILNIVQVSANTLQITSVSRVVLRPVHPLFPQTWKTVIFRVGVGKAVRGDQVNDI